MDQLAPVCRLPLQPPMLVWFGRIGPSPALCAGTRKAGRSADPCTAFGCLSLLPRGRWPASTMALGLPAASHNTSAIRRGPGANPTTVSETRRDAVWLRGPRPAGSNATIAGVTVRPYNDDGPRRPSTDGLMPRFPPRAFLGLPPPLVTAVKPRKCLRLRLAIFPDLLNVATATPGPPSAHSLSRRLRLAAAFCGNPDRPPRLAGSGHLEGDDPWPRVVEVPILRGRRRDGRRSDELHPPNE